MYRKCYFILNTPTVVQKCFKDVVMLDFWWDILTLGMLLFAKVKRLFKRERLRFHTLHSLYVANEPLGV